VLAVDFLPWAEAVVVPLSVALIVGVPSYLTALKVLRENRSQHGDAGDRLDAVHNEVSHLRSAIGHLDDKVDRFIHRTETWRDTVDADDRL
jgi:hypothetical protein